MERREKELDFFFELLRIVDERGVHEFHFLQWHSKKKSWTTSDEENKSFFYATFRLPLAVQEEFLFDIKFHLWWEISNIIKFVVDEHRARY